MVELDHKLLFLHLIGCCGQTVPGGKMSFSVIVFRIRNMLRIFGRDAVWCLAGQVQPHSNATHRCFGRCRAAVAGVISMVMEFDPRLLRLKESFVQGICNKPNTVFIIPSALNWNDL